jgi:hypothetical protein
MNIIQQQELARNSSEQQLISLAEQPNPSIMPPYLVTSELMRRKTVRDKMAQAPQQTVSEEVLTKAIQDNQPMGIGALTNQIQAPMVPQEEVMTESITETGVANLPAPNIGQNYAGGGIIGFANGGTAVVPYTGPGTAMVPYTSPGGAMVPYTPPAAPAQPGFFNKLLKGGLGLVKRHPYIAGGLGIASILGLTGDDEEEAPPIAPLPESMFVDTTPVDYTPKIDFSGMTIEDTTAYGNKMMEDHKARMGVDPFAAKRQEKLAALEADIGDSDDALNMALIRGGLGMASGDSQNFLTNLASGLTEGVDAYVAEDDKQTQQEMDLFALRSEIAAAERAEQIAIATTGTNSQATAEANNRKVELKKIEVELGQQEIDARVATSSNSAAVQAQKAILEIEDILNKNPMFSMAAMDPKIKALKDAERAELYRLRGLDQRTLNMAAAGISGGQQPMYQGFSATEIVE